MNEFLARKLCALNTDFYRNQAHSFSDTRHAAWPGWVQCLKTIEPKFRRKPERVVLDVACGNLRFEEFLAKRLPENMLRIYALDSCDDLVPDVCAGCVVNKSDRVQSNSEKRNGEQPEPKQSGSLPSEFYQVHSERLAIRYIHCDILDELYGAGTSAEKVQNNAGASAAKISNSAGALGMQRRLSTPLFSDSLGAADLSVSFGFMHHIPLMQWRVRLLQELICTTKPGGFVAVSFWRFMDDEGLASKAQKTHSQAVRDLGFFADDFEQGDYLLGWRNTPGAYRYCHSFSDADINYLIASIIDGSYESLRTVSASPTEEEVAGKSAKVVARFRADGRTENLNEYLILQVLERN